MTPSNNTKEIVLINPPNNQIVLRDFYSSTISKGKYNWPNIDLLSLSAILGDQYETLLIDANTNGDTIDDTLNIIKKRKNIVGVIVAIGKSVLEEDYNFVRQLNILLKKRNKDIKITVVGGIIYHNAMNELKENSFIDACILNFTTRDIVNYFNGDYDNLKNIAYRKNGELIETKIELPDWGFKIPVPKHHQLPLKKYQLSHGKNSPLASVITSYGCPHKCSFCVTGRIKYRYRDPSNILEELKYLCNIGVKEIIFRDNIFGFHKKTTIELLNGIIKNNLKFSWVSDSRVDVVDEDLLRLMSESGCHALHFGIETKNENILKEYEKNLKTTDRVNETIQLCAKYNIHSVGYFILGLPGETVQDVDDTIKYAIDLNCNYASFNLPMPIVGTDLRDKSIKQGWISNADANYDGSEPIISSGLIPINQLIYLQKKAYKKFYFRIRFVLKTIKNIKTLFQFRMLFIEGYHLLMNKR